MKLLVKKKILKIGRGIGAGFQFKFLRIFTLDIVAGYHLQNINSKTKLLKVKNSSKILS